MPIERCPWSLHTPEETHYHDTEWGVPAFDERYLFEMLILEGAQAGLSWATVLKKRAGYRRAFDNFAAERIAHYDGAKEAQLLADPGIVRNRLKVAATITNAQATLALAPHGGLRELVWGLVDGRPQVNQWQRTEQVPARSELSDTLSRELKRRGFKFIGSTICYAFLQAVGVINDHLVSCHRHGACQS